MPVPFKVCCIQDVEEAALALRHGAHALGLVSEMPSGPGVIPEETIAEVAAWASGKVRTFLLTSRQDPESIVEQHRRTRTDTIQLCDALSSNGLEKLRRALPQVKLVPVVHVSSEASIEEARSYAPFADAILLDSGSKSSSTKELGGTGRTHDWELSRRIREAVDKPIYLAGGMKPENVSEALQAVNPFAIDVCSGLRAEGRLDEGKLRRFAEALS